MLLARVFPIILLGVVCSAQYDETTTTTDLPWTTETDPEDTTTSLTTLEDEPFKLPEDEDSPVNFGDVPILKFDLQTVNLGILERVGGKSVKKRCRCIEKKHRKVVKEIKFIPLAPAIQFPGKKGNFTCNCSHLRKIVRNTSTTKFY